MRALWVGLEKLDHALFSSSQRLEKLMKKDTFRTRAEKSVEDIRPPQKAIQFDA